MKFEDIVNCFATKNAMKRSANVGERVRADVEPSTLLKRKRTFFDKKRIKKDCCEYGKDYEFRRFLLYILLNEHDYIIAGDEQVIRDKIRDFSKNLLKNEDYTHLSNRNKDIYSIVLDAIMEDKEVSEDELNILEKLRNKLGITLFQHWIILIKNNYFPEINTINQMKYRKLRSYLRNLERRGLVFYIKKDGDRWYVIPEEIAKKINELYDLELQLDKYMELLNNSAINNCHRRDFLEAHDIDNRGTSEELNKKIIFNGFKPSDFLNFLTTENLYNVAGKIGAKKSGTKDTKIRNIIKRYEEMYKPSKSEKDPRSIYYEFYTELANRDQSKLMKKGIIEKGEEIGKKFEEATTYLFGEVLGFKIKDPKIKNRRHGVKADGKAMKNGDFIIWDCKTKDKKLTISTSERRQFIDYINEYGKADSGKFISFLIITPDISKNAEIERKLNEIKTETDTDISVVKAEDLKKFAEDVSNSGTKINLKPFYHTKILDYNHLKYFIGRK